MNIKSEIRPLVLLFAVLALVTGVLYPLVVTGAAQALFPRESHGSLIAGKDGRVIGSELIGQSFSDPKHFWSRPSATSPQPYNGGSSGGSNLGPANPALADAVKGRVEALRAADPGNTAPVPIDLVTASGSGLDPHISVAAANYQVRRVARARGLPPARVQAIVDANTEGLLMGFLGEPRVNVLRLNLALDAMQ
ncbi:potassium-transporting ATPase subunit KdpC [Ramlibacter aquaticus]|uniref:Potassium-transporting ATPase KdpC subunit n=1 Tax=Ramlibacter aquaticus TaxID=2780094 RepID=A0ABR9SBG4_9BURK|nr:potassium-transporting ATPase subunit KdpC [Ramlibacter aquaticus]MBE7939686.1 potassium-transporting ATPase subunit KdpC [Ramlibacter aquaticus]